MAAGVDQRPRNGKLQFAVLPASLERVMIRGGFGRYYEGIRDLVTIFKAERLVSLAARGAGFGGPCHMVLITVSEVMARGELVRRLRLLVAARPFASRLITSIHRRWPFDFFCATCALQNVSRNP